MAQRTIKLFRSLSTSALFVVAGLGLTTLGITESANAEVAAIHLNDGTTVRGEVVGLKGDSYQIRTESLGELNIPQSKIKLVEFNPSAAQASANAIAPSAPNNSQTNAAAASSAMASITSRLQNSPGLMGDIQSLTNDPDVMAIVQDPEIQRLIAAGDYTTLMQNPKMRRLMSNSKIRSITNQLK